MSHGLRHGLLAWWILSLAAPMGAGEVLRVGGTGAGLGGLRVLAEAYQRQHPGQELRVLPSIGSTGGIRAVIDGKLDLGCTSRRLLEAERIPGLVEVPWATTAFVLATHPGVSVEPLSLAGLEDLYAGRRTRWPDGGPVRLILRPASDFAHAYLLDLSPGMGVALQQAHALPGVCIAITDQEALTALERTPGSLGTAVLGLIISEQRKLKVLGLDGRDPRGGNYPYTLSLGLVYRPEGASATTRAFLAFLGSKEGRRLLVRAGYRPPAADPPAKGR